MSSGTPEVKGVVPCMLTVYEAMTIAISLSTLVVAIIAVTKKK
ncbi:putative holin-like toxin [Priestia endophytica]